MDQINAFEDFMASLLPAGMEYPPLWWVDMFNAGIGVDSEEDEAAYLASL